MRYHPSPSPTSRSAMCEDTSLRIPATNIIIIPPSSSARALFTDHAHPPVPRYVKTVIARSRPSATRAITVSTAVGRSSPIHTVTCQHNDSDCISCLPVSSNSALRDDPSRGWTWFVVFFALTNANAVHIHTCCIGLFLNLPFPITTPVYSEVRAAQRLFIRHCDAPAISLDVGRAFSRFNTCWSATESQVCHPPSILMNFINFVSTRQIHLTHCFPDSHSAIIY